MMRVGLIGYGAWGQHHARALAAAPNARLTCIAARSNGEQAEEDWPDARVTGDWRSVAEDPSLDAVVVVVPNALHEEVATAALHAGHHVLLEKPMALTVAGCDRLIEAAQQARRVLSIGHEFRVSEQWGRAKALIEAGEIGVLEHAAITLFRFPYRTGSGGWRYEGARVGSWILEEPVHFFDLLLWYGSAWGPPLGISALAAGTPAMPRALAVSLRFAGDRFANVNTVLGGFEHHVTLHAMGEGGAIRATWSASMDRSTSPTATLHLVRGRAAPGQVAEPVPFGRSGEVFELARQAEQVIDGFQQGRPLVSPEEARNAVRCCLLAERSAREQGREIAWNEAVD
ncbi:MAG: Gfo/Idh/MocA family oxidoreductase [Acetobacteraceae bacterium]|nr:Gfo/Idh/MocA family oxidoreductase [Acetobacteraceae bacterium]